MANYTAADVKRLRELTGSGMMACKNALADADGDFDKAVEQLRINLDHARTGRALRDLDLKTRLFRYRCSPLIYSESFKGFPPELRTLVLTRLMAVLRAEQPAPEYAYLPAAERQAIYEILTATLPDLPAGWRTK